MLEIWVMRYDDPPRGFAWLCDGGIGRRHRRAGREQGKGWGPPEADRQSIWLQGSRGAEDFAPDDGLAEGGGGFDFERDLSGLGRSWLELANDGARRGRGCFLESGRWNLRRDFLRSDFIRHGDSKCLEESAHFLLGCRFVDLGKGRGRQSGFLIGAWLRLSAGALAFKTTLLTALAGLLDEPVDEADRSNNEEQDELFHRGIRPGSMLPEWLWSRAWRCRTGCFSSACSP